MEPRRTRKPVRGGEQALRALADQLRRRTIVVEGINRVFRVALTCRTEEELGLTCLAVAEQLTQSPFGFIGEVNSESGKLDDIAISDPGWDACRMQEPSGHGRRMPIGFAIHGIYGRVLRDGKGFFTNDPAGHPDRIGTPPGHPPLTCFLGVPLVHAGTTIGMIGLGNRSGGYGTDELEALETLAPAVVQAFLSKRTEQALRESEQRLRWIVDSNMVGVVFGEPGTGRLTDANDEFLRIIGRSREELVAGRINWKAITPPEHLAHEERLPSTTGPDGHVSPYEKEYLRPDGSRVPVIIGGSYFDVARDRAVAFAVDNTERKRTEDVLREADRRKDEFLALLSHELRNPLAPIRNSLYILDRAEPGGEQARRARAVIDRQVSQLSRLVDDLLDVTRIARHKVQLQPERLDLADLVRRSAEDNRSLFETKQVQFEVQIPERPIPVRADAARLSQVVGNLLQNAAKFTPPGGGASICVALDGGHAVVRVRDNGIGIAPDVLPHLFQPFTQADTAPDRSTGGLGLGLALVKALVELHRGQVSAHSEGQGRGAEFVVRLPLEGAAQAKAGRGALQVPPQKRRVLVIEDGRDAAESLRDVLVLGGHEVELAQDGPTGLTRALAFRPEVVICDIGLPGMDGYRVARAFREDERLRDSYLVALTAYGAPEDRERAAAAGFEGHLKKPASLETLQELLATVRREPSRS